MIRTLFILPSAIGDVIAGRGVAARLAAEGPVTWVVNELAAPVIADSGCELIHPPSPLMRRMASFGAPTETLRTIAEKFLARLSTAGPYDRIVQVHLTRAAALMAGAPAGSSGFPLRRGPAMGVPPHLPEGLISDPWSDFILGSIHHGVSPELAAPARFSLIAALSDVALPEDAPFSMPVPPGVDDNGPILLCPAAGWPSKELGPKQAAAIADALTEIGPVELLGAQHDHDLLTAIVSLQKRRPAARRIGPLSKALEAVRSARLVVTADSWPLHAATTANRPTLVLLGSTRVFPRGPRAAALAPAMAADWNAQEDRSIERIDADTVRSVAQSLLLPSPLEPDVIPDALRLWRGTGLHPLPNKPLPSDKETDARLILAWARARGFAAIIRKERPDLPDAALRAAADFPRLHANLPSTVTHAQKLMTGRGPNKFLDSFILFPTTFPGRDPEGIISAWIDATADALGTIKK